MSRRLIALALVTAVFVVAAIWAVATRQHASQAVAAGAPVLAGLKDRLNEVARVEIAGAKPEVTLELKDGRWTVAERAGYRANANRIQTLLVTLGDLVKIEPRTALPARYPEIGVEDPAAPGAKSSQVNLADAKGDDLGRLVIGNAQTAPSGSRSANTYVRIPDEAQSWLAQGVFLIDRNPAEWLDKELLVMVRERIKSVDIIQADGSALRISRATPSDTFFTIADVPADRMPRTPTVAAPVAYALGYLSLVDVRKASELDFATDVVKATWRTFDGLVVTVTSKDVDGKVWAVLDASADDAQIETAKGLDAVPGPDGTNLLKDSAAVAKEIVDLDAAWNGWAFAIEEAKARDLRARQADLLAPAANANPSAPPSLGGLGGPLGTGAPDPLGGLPPMPGMAPPGAP